MKNMIIISFLSFIFFMAIGGGYFFQSCKSGDLKKKSFSMRLVMIGYFSGFSFVILMLIDLFPKIF